MAQGLQVWDENGVISLDTNTDTVKIIGVYSGEVNTSVTSDLFLTERFFYIVNPPMRYPDKRYNDVPILDVKLIGNTCYVKSVLDEGSSVGTIFIGVY